MHLFSNVSLNWCDVWNCLIGFDCLTFTIIWTETQPGGVHLPLRHWHVRPPVLPRKLEGRCCVERGIATISLQQLEYQINFFFFLFGAETNSLRNLNFWRFAQLLLSLQSSRMHGCLGGMFIGVQLYLSWFVFYFWISDNIVCLDFQVYVRRAYIAYELNSIQHHQLLDGTCAVDFQFMLPSSHPNR